MIYLLIIIIANTFHENVSKAYQEIWQEMYRVSPLFSLYNIQGVRQSEAREYF